MLILWRNENFIKYSGSGLWRTSDNRSSYCPGMVDDSLLPAHSSLLTHLGFVVLFPSPHPSVTNLSCPILPFLSLHLLSFYQFYWKTCVFPVLSFSTLPAGSIHIAARCRDRYITETKELRRGAGLSWLSAPPWVLWWSFAGSCPTSNLSFSGILQLSGKFPPQLSLIRIFRLGETCWVGVVIFVIKWPWDALISPAASINQQNYVNIVTCCKYSLSFQKFVWGEKVYEMKQSEKYFDMTVWVCMCVWLILHVHTCCWVSFM